MASGIAGGDSMGRVLVVDDDASVREVLDRTLHRLGYQVLTAPDGLVALDLAASQHPQVILTDLRMPGVDGHTLLRRLVSAQIPSSVVVMSGQGNMDDVIEILREGAVDYLRKPWNPPELVGAVARAFALYEQRPHGEAAPASETSEVAARPTLAPAAAPPGDAPVDPWKQILARVRNGELLLPPVPAVVSSLRSMTQNPNVSLEEVAALIEQDQRIAADVLRLSNTAHYARGGRNHSIKVAVSRIGFRQIHNIVETALMRGAFQTHDHEIGAWLMQIWRYSVARAIAMRALASNRPAHQSGVHLDPDLAYLVGLLADVGASFLLWVVAERKLAGVPLRSAQPFLGHVRDHHEEVGGALLKQWLPDPTVIAAVTGHHLHPARTPMGYAGLAVVAADLIAGIRIGADITTRAPASPDAVAAGAAELGLDGSAIGRAMTSVQDSYAAVVASFDPTC